MGKWTKAAEKLKVQLDANESMATDMKVLISRISELPPGQMKKVLTEDVLEILRKYGVEV